VKLIKTKNSYEQLDQYFEAIRNSKSGLTQRALSSPPPVKKSFLKTRGFKMMSGLSLLALFGSLILIFTSADNDREIENETTKVIYDTVIVEKVVAEEKEDEDTKEEIRTEEKQTPLQKRLRRKPTVKSAREEVKRSYSPSKYDRLDDSDNADYYEEEYAEEYTDEYEEYAEEEYYEDTPVLNEENLIKPEEISELINTEHSEEEQAVLAEVVEAQPEDISEIIELEDVKEEFKNRTPGNTLYTGFLNVVPNERHIPLIGFVNIARGNHKSAEVGFINYAHGNFNTAQVGFVNTAIDTLRGAQVGFINTTGDVIKGSQIGFVNTAPKDITGTQFGFVNTTGGNMDMVQVSFLNTVVGNMESSQVGFVNIAAKKIDDAQVGFVNIANKVEGVQVGLINIARDAEDGVPVGLLNFIGEGGYYAAELSSYETSWFNFSLKFGVPKFYTTGSLAMNWNQDRLGYSIGFGSMFGLSDKLYINPEIFQHRSTYVSTQIWSTHLNLGYSLSNKISFVFAPTFSFEKSSRQDNKFTPINFSILSNEMGGSTKWFLGAKFGIRYNLTDWR
jgi:hypothetical protein